jgi:hypothetical protein
MILILAAVRGRREAALLLAGLEFLFGVIFFGLGFILLWTLVTEMIQRSVEWYRGIWGLEARLRRERGALTLEERRYFDEEMERLLIEGVNTEPRDEALLRKWREEDEELPGGARRRKRDAGE